MVSASATVTSFRQDLVTRHPWRLRHVAQLAGQLWCRGWCRCRCGVVYIIMYIYIYIYICICNMYILYIYICVYSIYTILCMTYYLCDVRMTHAHKRNKSRLFSPLSFSQLVSDLLRFSARLHSALLSFLNVCATHVSLLSFLWSSQSALVYVAFFLSFQEEV